MWIKCGLLTASGNLARSHDAGIQPPSQYICWTAGERVLRHGLSLVGSLPQFLEVELEA